MFNREIPGSSRPSRFAGLRGLAEKAAPLVSTAVNHGKEAVARTVNDAVTTQQAIIKEIAVWDRSTNKREVVGDAVLTFVAGPGRPSVKVERAGRTATAFLYAHYTTKPGVEVEVDHVRGPNGITIRFPHTNSVR